MRQLHSLRRGYFPGIIVMNQTVLQNQEGKRVVQIVNQGFRKQKNPKLYSWWDNLNFFHLSSSTAIFAGWSMSIIFKVTEIRERERECEFSSSRRSTNFPMAVCVLCIGGDTQSSSLYRARRSSGRSQSVIQGKSSSQRVFPSSTNIPLITPANSETVESLYWQ